jgi:hypothetical protein
MDLTWGGGVGGATKRLILRRWTSESCDHREEPHHIILIPTNKVLRRNGPTSNPAQKEGGVNLLDIGCK